MRRPLASFDRFAQSLGKFYSLLERPRAACCAVAALLAVHTALLAYSAYVHSPTLNEPGHLVAGLSHWKFGRFELYRVNPPLVRMVAALPVMAAGYEEDWTGFHEGPGARPVFGMGEQFVAANGERSLFLFMIARWACIPFSWIGGIVCYLWARDLYGRPSGVFASALWCFSPNILAHASLITADAHATALGLAACYTFWRWLKKPTWTQAALTGVVLGIAELAKTTLILFYPLWPLLWLIYRWPDRARMYGRDWLREAGMLLLRMAIGLYVLNLGYGFEGSFKPLKEFHFVSNLFTGKEEVGSRQKAVDNRQSDSPTPSPQSLAPSYNRFASSWLSPLPVPFPKNYLLGIDIQQRDFENYGRPSYLRGEWQDHGWWYYYLYAAAIKVPLGTLLLGVFTLLISLCTSFLAPRTSSLIRNSHKDLTTKDTKITSEACEKKKQDEHPVRLIDGNIMCQSSKKPRRFSFLRALCGEKSGLIQKSEIIFLLTPPLVILCVVSSKTGFSEHFRYVLPCFPFLFIWISGFTPRFCKISKNLLDISDTSYTMRVSSAGRRTKRLLAKSATLILLLWSVASSLWIYPHSLSYFNESIGGPLNGPEHLLGSNVDWGQDLIYIARRLNASTSTSPLSMAYLAAIPVGGSNKLCLGPMIAGFSFDAAFCCKQSLR